MSSISQTKNGEEVKEGKTISTEKKKVKRLLQKTERERKHSSVVERKADKTCFRGLRGGPCDFCSLRSSLRTDD